MALGRSTWTWTRTTPWLLPGSCCAKHRRQASGESNLESRFWAGVPRRLDAGVNQREPARPESRAPGSQPAGPLLPKETEQPMCDEQRAEMLNAEQKAKYLQDDGGHCPYCGTWD